MSGPRPTVSVAAVFRHLRNPKWLGALVLALVLATAFLFLGRWQWGRHEAKQARADLVQSNYDRSPVSLDRAFPDGQLDPTLQWVPVRVTGRYDAEQQILVRNRPLRKSYGFEALVPLTTSDGRVVLVNRGWLPYGEGASAVPPVPGSFSGEVTVIGWARPAEKAVSQTDQRMQLTAMDAAGAERLLARDVVDGYLVLQQETRPDGRRPERPAELEPPSTDTGPHFAYALQWWGAMLLAPLLVLWGVRRELAEEAWARIENGEDPRRGARRQRAQDLQRDSTPRRRPRLWDTDREEDDEYSGVQ